MVTTLRKRKRLLALLNAGLLATITLCAYHLLGNPATAGPAGAAIQPADEGPGANAVAVAGPLKRTLFTRDYRRPLYDVIIVKGKVKAPPEPKLTVTCVGTISGGRNPLAMLRRRKGDRPDPVRIGKSFDDAKVTAIDANSVTVEFHGKTITLQVERD